MAEGTQKYAVIKFVYSNELLSIDLLLKRNDTIHKNRTVNNRKKC